jgi:two-component system sensor histidine kinase KdpD
LAGIFLIALVTLIGYGLGLNLSTVSFFYLIIIVLQALAGDFGSSALVSLVALFALDYFFAPPTLSFAVRDGMNIVALAAFLITGLVITRLTSDLRSEAKTSELQRVEMKRLYDVAQILLRLDPQETLPAKLLVHFHSVFHLRAVCLFVASTADRYVVGESNLQLAERTRSAYIEGRDVDDSENAVALRCLRVSDRVIGAIAFEGLRDPRGTAGSLASLAGAALERARAFQQASQSAGAAQAEAFRGAILDALAHEFKTPLATVLAAMSGLTEAGALHPEQQAFVETAQAEVLRLNILTSRLLRMAKLDREEVSPQIEVTDVTYIIAQVVDQYAKHWADHEISFHRERPGNVAVDPELIRLVLSQLLENACKYSPPGSRISVSLSFRTNLITVRIWNSGSFIPPEDRSRIFERYYRGTNSQRLPAGSGLGLYVARKIALAHGGNLKLEEAASGTAGTAFCLDLPSAEGVSYDVDRAVQCASGR